MAAKQENDMVNEVLLKDKLVEIWPDYPCLYTQGQLFQNSLHLHVANLSDTSAHYVGRLVPTS